jgi:probable rRNA maturation factor
MANIIRVTTRGGPFSGVDPRSLRLRAGKMLDHLGLAEAELSIALVDDACIRDLNWTYRSIDRPTDVLAFAMGDGEQVAVTDELPQLLGDVVISVPTAGKQARRMGHGLLDELTTLLAHGLLHLLGRDHATRADEREMKRRTAELKVAARQRRSSAAAG